MSGVPIKYNLLEHSEIAISLQSRETNEPLFFDCTGKMVVGKIWRGLTFHLNTLVGEKVNLVLKKRPLAQIIANNETLAKYEYVSNMLKSSVYKS
jgi:hypothetical protein